MQNSETDVNIYARCEPVPYIVHESDMARMDRTNKRLTAIVLVLIFALALSWGGFFLYESQFETVTETTVQDVWQDSGNGGVNRFVGGDYNGNSTGEDSNDENLQTAQGAEP